MAGGGAGLTLDRGDDGETESAVGVARLSLDRGFSPSLRLGLEWLGSWMEGSFGGESRHHVGVIALVHQWDAPVVARLGVGLGTATVVEVDGPTPGGPAGDADIGIGDTGGVGGVVGVEVQMPLVRGLHLVPAADLMIQRAGGYGYVTGMLTGRLLLGPWG